MKGAQHLRPSFWIEMVPDPDLILCGLENSESAFLGEIALSTFPFTQLCENQESNHYVGSEAHLRLYKDLGTASQHQASSRANKRWHSYEVGLHASQGDAPLHLLMCGTTSIQGKRVFLCNADTI